MPGTREQHAAEAQLRLQSLLGATATASSSGEAPAAEAARAGVGGTVRTWMSNLHALLAECAERRGADPASVLAHVHKAVAAGGLGLGQKAARLQARACRAKATVPATRGGGGSCTAAGEGQEDTRRTVEELAAFIEGRQEVSKKGRAVHPHAVAVVAAASKPSPPPLSPSDAHDGGADRGGGGGGGEAAVPAEEEDERAPQGEDDTASPAAGKKNKKKKPKAKGK